MAAIKTNDASTDPIGEKGFSKISHTIQSQLRVLSLRKSQRASDFDDFCLFFVVYVIWNSNTSPHQVNVIMRRVLAVAAGYA